jgi:hypothetical protein
MKLIINNNIVTSIHRDDQNIESIHPTLLVIIVLDTYKISIGDNITQHFTVPIAKAAMHTYIDYKMREHRELGFTCTNGIKLQCTEFDMVRWMQAKMLMTVANVTTTPVRDYTNNVHIVSDTEFNIMMVELGNYVLTLLTHSWELKDTIDSLENIEDILNIRY